MTLIAVVVGLGAVLIALALFLRKPAGDDKAVRDLRGDVLMLRESTEKSMQNANSLFSSQLQAVTQQVQTSLASVTDNLGNRLDSINRQVTEQLNQGSNAMNASTHVVSEQVTAVQNTFAGLQKQVGEMTEQARQLSELSRSVNAIEHVLRAPKMRGQFGEEQLENLLGLVFSRQQYALQYRFSTGEVADAVLFLPLGHVAVDSKFPLENFRRITELASEDERKVARRDFLRDVRKRVDEVAAKYIRPAEGTLPFALMYVPAENVYYETIIRNEDEPFQLYRYCLEKRVIPVSPNSLYAYLQTIMMGLKGMQVNQQAEAIVRDIESLKIELEKFTKSYETVGQHIRNAAAKLEDGSKLLNKVELRVEGLAGGGAADQQTLFDEKKKILDSDL
ncbi:MAG TPA: DNA recombination protein RmuC [Candidatus Angelobacter sp.]|nr:DNA recombination protein RmuC [Candidatus Angelobacter sp.]